MVIERKETEWVAKAGSSDDGVILNCEANATVREREVSEGICWAATGKVTIGEAYLGVTFEELQVILLPIKVLGLA